MDRERTGKQHQIEQNPSRNHQNSHKGHVNIFNQRNNFMGRVFFPGISVFFFTEILHCTCKKKWHANSSVLKRTTSIHFTAFLNFFLDFKCRESDQMWPELPLEV